MTEPGQGCLKRRRFQLIGGFSIVALLIYGWSVTGGFLNWDDPTYVLHNPELRDGSGLGSIFSTFYFSNYNPLHRLSYWFEWQLAGDSAWLFRLTNLLLHVLNAVLLFELLREWFAGRAMVALVAAALFLVHPSNVETVAWISERKSLLATAFAFASTLCWLRGHRGLALVLFVLGLLSKTSIVPLPLFFVLLDWSRSDGRWRQLVPDLLWYGTLLGTAFVFGVVQVFAAQSGDATRSLHGGSLGSHIATAVAVLPHYAFHFVLPFWLTPRHAFEPATFSDPRTLLGLAMLAAIGFGVVRSCRGERRFVVAIGWALGALLLTVIVPIPILLADRYWYFAMPLLLGVIVDGASRMSLGAFRPGPTVLRAAAVTALLVGCVGSFAYARAWRDSTGLWTHALALHPTDVQAWISLGAARHESMDGLGAMQAYGQALELDPDNADAVESLANVELQGGKIRAAEQRLAALLQSSPERTKARAMLAACFDLQGNTARAAAEFAILLAQNESNPEVRRAVAAFVGRHPECAAKLRASGAAPGR